MPLAAKVAAWLTRGLFRQELQKRRPTQHPLKTTSHSVQKSAQVYATSFRMFGAKHIMAKLSIIALVNRCHLDSGLVKMCGSVLLEALK